MTGNGLKSLRILFCTLILTLGCGSAHAAVVISGILDGDGSANLFDPATTTILGNVITIGLNNFTADAGVLTPPNVATAVDSLILTISTTLPNEVITEVTYAESGVANTGADGLASASGTMLVDGQLFNFLTATVLPNSMLNATWGSGGDVIVANKSSILVSITHSLIAAIFGPGAPANISKTAATLTVTTALIPLPPAAWLFGTALVALVSIGVRRHVSD